MGSLCPSVHCVLVCLSLFVIQHTYSLPYIHITNLTLQDVVTLPHFVHSLFSEPNKTEESSGDSGRVGQEAAKGTVKNESTQEVVREKTTVFEGQHSGDNGAENGSGHCSDVDGGGLVVPEGPFQLPPADCISLTSQDETAGERLDDDLSSIIAPPHTFSGDDSATPTPQLETESVESGTITPRISPCDINTPLSPLSPYPNQIPRTTLLLQ